MSGPWPLRLLRWVYVAFIATASVQSAIAGANGAHANFHDSHLLPALAIAETLAALALLIEVRSVERVACVVLVAVYAVAAALSVRTGFVAPFRFAYYAATAMFIAAPIAQSPAA